MVKQIRTCDMCGTQIDSEQIWFEFQTVFHNPHAVTEHKVVKDMCYGCGSKLQDYVFTKLEVAAGERMKNNGTRYVFV